MGEESGSGVGLTGWLGIGTVTFLAVWIWKACRVYTTFSDLGIPGPKPTPLLGNSRYMMKHGLLNMIDEFLAKYGKVFGMFFTTRPQLVIADLDMLRDIMVKKFQYFPDREHRSDLRFKPWKYLLLHLQGDHWKHVRSTLSPTFSSGKIKRVTPAIQRVNSTLVEHLRDLASKGEMVEVKSLFQKYGIDVLGGVAFGMELNSLTDKEELFAKHASSIVEPSKFEIMLFVFVPQSMKIFNFLGIKTRLLRGTDFFMNLAEMAMQDHTKDPKKGHNFLQLLMETEAEGSSQAAVDEEINHRDQLNTTHQWTRKGLSRDEMLSNVFLFLLAGFETVSTTMSFTLFCLANNPEYLKKAQEEVDKKLGKRMISYEDAYQLTYLDMCVNEALRIFPPGFIVNRQTSGDVEVGGMKIKKGMAIVIPVRAIHMDPQTWPEPEKFDPERHTPEARAERHPFSFMPFGLGPRNCIGMRLAQLEVRMGVATVLQHFTPVACEKTVYPPKLMKLRMRAEEGLWLRLQPRE